MTTEELLAQRSAFYARHDHTADEYAAMDAIENTLRDRNEVPCAYCRAPSPFGLCERCGTRIAHDQS